MFHSMKRFRRNVNFRRRRRCRCRRRRCRRRRCRLRSGKLEWPIFFASNSF